MKTALLALLLALPVVAQPEDLERLVAEGTSWTHGDDRSDLGRIESVLRETKNDDRLHARRLLRAVLAGEATNDCKRFVCTQLGLIGTGQDAAALMPLVRDPALSHAARGALEAIGDNDARAALRDLLDEPGHVRLGVIGSLGRLRDAAAVEPLGALAKSEDEQTRAAAIRALGAIGDAASIKVLLALPRDTGMRAELLDALLVAAGRAERLSALEACGAIIADRTNPTHVRLAAVRILVERDDPRAIGAVLNLLQAPDPQWWGFGIELVRTTDAPRLEFELLDAYSTLSPTGRARCLDALAARRSPDLTSFITVEMTSEAEPVRLAALRALGVLGRAESGPVLARHAARSSGIEQEEARRSLHTSSIPGIDGALSYAIGPADQALKLEIIHALGVRHASTEAALLLPYARNSDEPVRHAALRTLAMISTELELPTLLAFLVRADPSDQALLENAVVETCRRIGAPETRASPIVYMLGIVADDAKAPLLRALGALGGAQARAAINEHASVPALRGPCIEALSRWPDPSPASDLLALARSEPQHRGPALAGYVRCAGFAQLDNQTRFSMYTDAIDLADSDELRIGILEGLATLSDERVVDLASPFADQFPVPASLAMLTGAEAGSQRTQWARSVVARVLERTSDEQVVARAAETRRQIDQLVGFIRDWSLSGPYRKQGAGGGELIDVAFPPERSEVEWKSVGTANPESPGVVDLLRIHPGNNACTYLRANVTVGAAREAVLEIGSDDGVKVWLNGEVVHSNNAMRGLTPNQDRVPVNLKAGSNTLLMKITQGSGDWRACCRIVEPDGRPIEDLQ